VEQRRRGGWRVERIPVERLPQIEMVPALALRHPMHAFLEVDVSEVRHRLRMHRHRTGERWSFTAFVIFCVARAIHEHRDVQAFRRGRTLLVYDQVDVATMIEVDAGGARVPLSYVIRDAAVKSIADIHAEIRAVQHDPAPLLRDRRRQIERMRRVPRPVRWVLWRILARSPRRWQRLGGTVTVTSVGMFGTGRGWGQSVAAYPVSVAVGAITPAPRLHHDDVLDNREQLCLTVTLDHEVVDGAAAARFLAFLRVLIEEGHGLASLLGDEGEEPSPALTAR
jgi:pyruvate/2-oxoglutarate dehydrogenase complex dihydrolipoamide acyltransferase (E2) component